MSPHWQGDQPGQRESFGVSKRSSATSFWKTKWRMACTVSTATLSSTAWDSPPPGSPGLGMKLRLQRSDPGRGPELAAWRQLEETGLWLTESALGGKPGPASQALLQGAWGEGRDCSQSLLLPVHALRQQETTYTSSGSGCKLLPSSWAAEVHCQCYEKERKWSCSAVYDFATPYCSLPGSSVHGILQARTLEWVAISFSRGSSWPMDRTQVSCLAGRFFHLSLQRSPAPKASREARINETWVSRRKEITKIRAEINEIEIIENINESKSWFFEKINKIYKPLARLKEKKDGSNE